jgi:CheY-like chemotaxis protein
MATLKILLVDDTKLCIELEKSFLKLSPVRILTATTGDEALEIARKEHPDLIFLDIHMPGMDGIACCREIKSDPSLRSIPVVMVTSSGTEEYLEKCKEAGCDAFVTKPINRRVFLEKARAYCNAIDRRELRIPFRTPVTCNRTGLALSAEIADISAGGVYLACDQEIEENAELLLVFVLSEDEKLSVEAKGRVAWVNTSRKRKKLTLPAGFGVEFVEIHDDAGEAIRTLIETQLTAE